MTGPRFGWEKGPGGGSPGRSGRTAALLLVALAVFSVPATAQTSDEADTRSTLDGVYSAEQAEEGRATFEDTCAACHAPGFFRASTFQRSWSGRALYWLFKQIRTTMPEDNPGSLKPREVAEVLAYILSLNGYPTGELPLPGDDDALRLIILEELPDG